MEALPPEMKLLILRLLVAADLASACPVNKDLFSLEADDQDCLWRRLFLAVCNHPAPNRLPPLPAPPLTPFPGPTLAPVLPLVVARTLVPHARPLLPLLLPLLTVLAFKCALAPLVLVKSQLQKP